MRPELRSCHEQRGQVGVLAVRDGQSRRRRTTSRFELRQTGPLLLHPATTRRRCPRRRYEQSRTRRAGESASRPAWRSPRGADELRRSGLGHRNAPRDQPHGSRSRAAERDRARSSSTKSTSARAGVEANSATGHFHVFRPGKLLERFRRRTFSTHRTLHGIERFLVGFAIEAVPRGVESPARCCGAIPAISTPLIAEPFAQIPTRRPLVGLAG